MTTELGSADATGHLDKNGFGEWWVSARVSTGEELETAYTILKDVCYERNKNGKNQVWKGNWDRD